MPKPTSARDLHATDGFRRELLAEVEALGDPAARRERRSAAPLKGPRLNLYRDAQIVLRRPRINVCEGSQVMWALRRSNPRAGECHLSASSASRRNVRKFVSH